MYHALRYNNICKEHTIMNCTENFSSLFILEIKNFINANLTEDITLEKIAKQFHFSSFWISRYYHRITGENIMEYVRKQRLRCAASELLFGKYNIGELALKYGYDSQDGFCRAFKKYYGVTCGEYKAGRCQYLV